MRNHTCLRMFCLILAVCLLCPWCLVRAEEPTQPEAPVVTEPAPTEAPTEPDPSEEPTEPELPDEPTEPEPTEPEPTEPPHDPAEDYDIPDDYAHDALVFAVRNGILFGVGGRNLDPYGNMTRAQLAAVLVRTLALTEEGDLSAFRDMDPSSSLYQAVSIAYKAGILYGTSSTTMNPNGYVTREQASAMIARAFGIAQWDRSGADRFTDSGKISAYARDAVGALTGCQAIYGYTSGAFGPKDYITREQAVAILYRVVNVIAAAPEDLPEEGYAVCRSGEALPETLSLDGTLTTQVWEDMTARNWQIPGRLTLRGSGSISVETLETDLCALVGDLCLETGNTQSCVLLGGDGSVLRSDAESLIVSIYNGSGDVYGTCGQVSVRSGNGNLHQNVTTLILDSGTSAQVDGNVETAIVYGNASLSGAGHVGKVIKYGRSPAISVAYDTLEDRYDYGLEGVTVSVSNPGKLTKKQQTVTVTATFTGGTYEGAGLTNGKRLCTLRWYVNGNPVSTVNNFALSDGASASCDLTYDLSQTGRVKDTVTVKLSYQEKSSLSGSTTVASDDYWADYYYALKTVKRGQPRIDVKKTGNFYTDSNMTKVGCTLHAGDTLYLEMNYNDGTWRVRKPDGTLGYVYDSIGTISSDPCTDGTKDYSTATKEGFVNEMGYSSSTSYLIWVSKQTQKVLVFTGSKGNWKLKSTYTCATGANVSPTPDGVYAINDHEPKWWYTGYYVDNVSIFYGGYAFHSILYNNDGSIRDNTMGKPASHGCVRMWSQDANAIFNLPDNTAVVIY